MRRKRKKGRRRKMSSAVISSRLLSSLASHEATRSHKVARPSLYICIVSIPVLSLPGNAAGGLENLAVT